MEAVPARETKTKSALGPSADGVWSWSPLSRPCG